MTALLASLICQWKQLPGDLAVAGVILGGSLFGVPASASNPTLTAEYCASLGAFGRNAYTYVEGTMTGTVRGTGSYSVPFILIYPEVGNGVTLVDWPNTVLYDVYRDKDGNPSLCPHGSRDTGLCKVGSNNSTNLLQHFLMKPFGRTQMETYLYETGYTYFAIQWHKQVTDFHGPTPSDGVTRRQLAFGTIDEATDHWEILTDAARVSKEATSFKGLPNKPAAKYTVMYGFSQTAQLGLRFLSDPAGNHNKNGASLFYDGFLLVRTVNICEDLANDSTGYTGKPGGPSPGFQYDIPCGIVPPSGDAKVINIDSEADVLSGGFETRDDQDTNPNYRKWEVAGIAHITGVPGNFEHLSLGYTHNTIESRQLDRSALAAMKAWLENDTAPPPSTNLSGTIGVDGFMADRDADGNILGGLRLPHMRRILTDGNVVGAPMGKYTPLNNRIFENPECIMPGQSSGSGLPTEKQAFPAVYAWCRLVNIAGLFEPFNDLATRYPNEKERERLILASADALIAERYVLERDRESFLFPAAPDVPEPPVGPLTLPSW